MAGFSERLKHVPRSVWTLGFVSMFMDISSEMIHGLLPVFLVTGLGASAAALGLIDGIAEATAGITKVYSGWLSDRLGKRKLLAVIGYGLSALTKPLFPMASTVFEVMAARFFDRVGKGIRGAPRDALVADVTPAHARGLAYGVRQSIDTVGAFLGPLIAVGLMWLLADNIRAVFVWAVIPAALAVLLLVVGIREPDRPSAAAVARQPIRWGRIGAFSPAFWVVVAIGSIFTMARFSEAFLLLRAQGAGLAIALVPLVLVLMNVVYSLVSGPAGSLSDRVDRRLLLAAGLVVLVIADLTLALAQSLAAVLAGVALWGLHMGLTQGVMSAMVADAAPADARGTAFGVFNLVTGVLMLASSTLAGGLWSAFGPKTTFVAGAAFAATAGLALVLIRRRSPPDISSAP